MTQFQALSEPFNIGATLLKNRVAVAPMTRVSASPEGVATQRMSDYYATFAHGGFGLIITEGTYTDEAYSQCYWNQPGIANDEQAIAWKKIVDGVHATGTKIFIQLEHAGPLSQGNRFVSGNLGASAIAPVGEPLAFYGGRTQFPTPQVASEADIDEIIEGFVQSALRAEQAGFDGIEIHGANGYLLDSFFTAYTNHRTDRYGRTVSNRIKLAVQVSKAIRQAVNPDFTVGIRISQGKVNDYAHKWSGGQADAQIIFEELGKAGLDYIHITEYRAWSAAFEDGSDASLIHLAKRYSGLPILANGQLENPVKAVEVLTSKDADLVTLGKGALANRNWIKIVQEGGALSEFKQNEVLRPDATIKDFELL